MGARFWPSLAYNLIGAIFYVWLPLAAGVYYWDQRAKVIDLDDSAQSCPLTSSQAHKDALSDFADNVTKLFFIGGIFALLDVLVVTANTALAQHSPNMSGDPRRNA